VYDLLREKISFKVNSSVLARRSSNGIIRLYIGFLLGGVKVYQTPVYEATALNLPDDEYGQTKVL
jgi:hypothetical protein